MPLSAKHSIQFLLLLASIFFHGKTFAQKPVNLQLKWYHQFQFAGYYAAQKQGYYKQVGLDVAISEGTPTRLPIKTVLEGVADYGISGPDIMTSYLQEKPVVVTAVIFQHSADVFLSLAKSGIRTPTDLVRKKIMAHDEHGFHVLRSIFLREGIPLDSIKFMNHSWKLDDLISGKADAITAYSTVEPQQLRGKGHQVTMIHPIDYGIDFYGDLIFTTRAKITQDPEEVQAFTKASIKGWEYAMSHKHELADYILALPGVKERGITKAFLLEEAREMEKLILPGLIEVGHINTGRWNSMLSLYKDLGVANKDANIDDLIYKPTNTRDNVLAVLVVILIAATIISIGILLWNWQLQKQVTLKTSALRAENKQRFEAEQRLDLAIKAAGLGLWEWDVPKGEIRLDEKGASLLGYTQQDAPLNIEDWINRSHPEDKERVALLSDELIHNDNNSNSVSYRIKTALGSWKWLLSFRRVITRDEKGNAERITGMFLDIDSIKNRENELNEISKELVKKNNELEKFAYITSHNLRAPVVNLKSLTEIYTDGEMDEAVAADIFSKIKQSVNRLDSTLNDLIEIVSSKEGETINLESLNLESELKYVMSTIEKQLTESGAQVHYDFAEARAVNFSRRYLHSIFLNLLTNAIKYRSMERPLAINMKSYPHKGFIYFVFEDNGIGIDMDKFKNKIFGLYQRFNPEREGKGLGLYIIKSQIEALDGKISVASELGKSTTFKILFYDPSPSLPS